MLAFFGGLCHVELINLEIEKMMKKNDVMLVTQCRSKQLSDKQETKFLVPIAMGQSILLLLMII